MHSHLFKFLLALCMLAAVVVAQDVERDDVPSQCQDVCEKVVKWSKDCDDKFDHRRRRSAGGLLKVRDDDDDDDDDNDDKELQCICNSDKASTVLPICEACIAKYNRKGHDNGTLYNSFSLEKRTC